MHNFTPTEYIFERYASRPIKSVKDERNLLILPAKSPFIRVCQNHAKCPALTNLGVKLFLAILKLHIMTLKTVFFVLVHTKTTII